MRESQADHPIALVLCAGVRANRLHQALTGQFYRSQFALTIAFSPSSLFASIP